MIASEVFDWPSYLLDCKTYSKNMDCWLSVPDLLKNTTKTRDISNALATHSCTKAVGVVMHKQGKLFDKFRITAKYSQ